MVQWKGKLEENVGSKAENLDRLEDFNVPNFFVLTPEETKRLFKGAQTREEILNTELEAGKKEEVKNGFREIGMSSEVRTAAGKAKSLVGGQRNGQHVSIRVSDHGKGSYDYKLNVGSSNLFNAVKKVAASYIEQENDYPSIIVQKMVEPDYTGAVIPSYSEKEGIIEVVEGLGHGIEEGITRPQLYIFENGRVTRFETPDEQIKISVNPINGGEKKKKVTNPDKPFSKSKAEDIFRKVSRKGMSVKFVYKRGSFHIVDAWSSEEPVAESIGEVDGLKVTKGDPSGTVGRDITYSDETLPPENYKQLISRKGFYTSTDSQKARKKGKKALMSFDGELEHGKRFNTRHNDQQGRKSEYDSSHPFQTEDSPETDTLTGSEVLPLNPSQGRGLFTSPPFGQGYRVSRQEGDISENSYLKTCADVFGFEGDKAVLDIRNMEKKAVLPAVKYLDSDLKILVTGRVERDTVLEAFKQGFEVFATEKRSVDSLKRKVAEAEKKFMLDSLRESSN